MKNETLIEIGEISHFGVFIGKPPRQNGKRDFELAALVFAYVIENKSQYWPRGASKYSETAGNEKA